MRDRSREGSSDPILSTLKDIPMSLRNILFAVVTVAAAAVCARLGVWQLDRLAQRRAANATLRAVRSAPPVDLNQPHGSVREGNAVSLTGHYLPQETVVLRGRSYEGSPGVVLATPLALAGSDSIVMVIRGFVPSPDAATADPAAYPPGDSATIAGMAIAIPDSDGTDQVVVRGIETWRRLALPELRRRIANSVAGVGVQRLPDSSLRGFPLPLAPAELNDGPHLSYAIQWFSFATIALVGGAIWLRRGTKNT